MQRTKPRARRVVRHDPYKTLAVLIASTSTRQYSSSSSSFMNIPHRQTDCGFERLPEVAGVSVGAVAVIFPSSQEFRVLYLDLLLALGDAFSVSASRTVSMIHSQMLSSGAASRSQAKGPKIPERRAGDRNHRRQRARLTGSFQVTIFVVARDGYHAEGRVAR